MANDDDNISKLVVLVLGIATIGFFALLIFKEIRGYRIGGGQPQQMSLADDSLFDLERRLHQLETARNVRTLKPVQKVEQSTSTEYLQTPDAPMTPRKVVTMNSTNKQNILPNVHNLSKADQDKVRRMFFDMR